jgi:hypothetical protein
MCAIIIHFRNKQRFYKFDKRFRLKLKLKHVDDTVDEADVSVTEQKWTFYGMEVKHFKTN